MYPIDFPLLSVRNMPWNPDIHSHEDTHLQPVVILLISSCMYPGYRGHKYEDDDDYADDIHRVSNSILGVLMLVSYDVSYGVAYED